MKVQRKYNEPGAKWTEIKMAEAVRDLDGYWKPGTAEPMLREGQTLWTPWAQYRIKGATGDDNGESLDGISPEDVPGHLKGCTQSFHPNIHATTRTETGRAKATKALVEIMEREKVGITSAMNILEAHLRDGRKLPPAYWRARLSVLDDLTARHRKKREKHENGSEKHKRIELKVRALLNGVFPPGIDGQALIEKRMEKDYPEQFRAWKAGEPIHDQPLTFEEMTRYSTWLHIFPERILGEQGFDTSRGFPIKETGAAEEADLRLSQMPEPEPNPRKVNPVQRLPKPLAGLDGDGGGEVLSGGPMKRGRKKRPYQFHAGLLKKYVGLDGKKKSKAQVGKLLDEFQAAIRKGRVSKTHPHGRDFMYAQKKLLALFNDMRTGEKRDLLVAYRTRKDFGDVVSWEGRLPGEILLEQFLALIGKPNGNKEIHTLCWVIRRSLKRKRILEPFTETARKALRILIKAGADGVKVLKVQKRIVEEVRGVLGLSGSAPALDGVPQADAPEAITESNDVQIIRSDQIPDNSHLRYDFGPWRDIFRSPLPGFWTMVFGRDKLGKSTLVNQFAKFLAHKGHQILWIEFEEDVEGVFNNRLEALKAKHPNMSVAQGIPKDMTPFEFVVINSVSEENLSPKFLTALKKKYKGTGVNFILIYKATKKGDYLGESGHGHLPDIKIEVKKKGLAIASGRYGIGEGQIPYTEEQWDDLVA